MAYVTLAFNTSEYSTTQHHAGRKYTRDLKAFIIMMSLSLSKNTKKVSASISSQSSEPPVFFVSAQPTNLWNKCLISFAAPGSCSQSDQNSLVVNQNSLVGDQTFRLSFTCAPNVAHLNSLLSFNKMLRNTGWKWVSELGPRHYRPESRNLWILDLRISTPSDIFASAATPNGIDWGVNLWKPLKITWSRIQLVPFKIQLVPFWMVIRSQTNGKPLSWMEPHLD